ncbi:MAG: divalent-cation tolerance protein CutA [Gammaproteobacteria bacterium]|nr:divalent-cation tolerance protein CutA [Gammaproteobacteria bacterium]
MSEDKEYLIVLNTCPGSITAKQIAQDLVANNHAACVNIIPGIQSVFKWGNQVKNETEYLLIIKTSRDNYAVVEKRIRALHPYELPEVIAVPITEGLDGYLNWIKQVIH